MPKADLRRLARSIMQELDNMFPVTLLQCRLLCEIREGRHYGPATA
jgi:hypothetical protein